jgi:hypothetical protein
MTNLVLVLFTENVLKRIESQQLFIQYVYDLNENERRNFEKQERFLELLVLYEQRLGIYERDHFLWVMSFLLDRRKYL